MSNPKSLVLGTRNEKKRLELAELLAPLGVEVLLLSGFAEAVEVVEDGETFADNAVKKAVEQARALRRWVLAEDSGLSVAALDGRPSVYSARYAGPHATDEQNNQRLLEELGDTPLSRRTAHYVCHAALADPAGEIHVQSEATCHGRIVFQPRGTGGFGYDPLFELPEYHRTFGQLGPAVKATLSHRARALRQLRPRIAKLLK